MFKNKEAQNIFSVTSGHVLPLATAKERLIDIWHSLTWPVFKKILKANIALIITLGLMCYYPIMNLVGVSSALAPIAVEFILPSKSLGFLAEDAIFGAFMCSVSAAYAILGTYCASLVQQANVGGMLSALIMVLNLTGAVLDRHTTVYIQELVKTLETFDIITRQQVEGFLHSSRQHLLEQGHNPESPTVVHNKTDTLLSSIIDKKRMTQREISFNKISPVDISELTKIVKRLRIPLQGIAIAHTMESNMRKLYLLERVDDIYHNRHDHPRESPSPINIEKDNSISNLLNNRPNSENFSRSSNEGYQTHPSSSGSTRQPVTLDATAFKYDILRREYTNILNESKTLYIDLLSACSLAMAETIKRLLRIQCIDPFQDKPFFYKYLFGKKGIPNTNVTYDRNKDPSLQLLAAIQHFDAQRLNGLARLYNENHHPRRTLLLILKFQFSLRTYAEILYTLSSLVFELDQVRDQRRFWLPSVSIKKMFWKKRETSYDLDLPSGVAQQPSNNDLQRTLTQHTDNDKWFHQHDRQNKKQRRNTIDTRNRQRRDSHHSAFLQKLMTWRHHIGHRKTSLTHTILVDQSSYHDPDSSYPITRRQYFFYVLWKFGRKYIYTRDTAFALRAAILVTMLTLPGFLEQSLYWYNRARGQWATVVALIWMGPSVGSSFFGTMARTVGTLVGAAVGIIIWEISQNKLWALLIVTFVFNIPFYVLYTLSSFWRATGLFCLITITLIIGYGYVYMSTDVPISAFQVTYQRIASVFVGVGAAMMISILPYAQTSRVQVRYRVSHIMNDMGVLYASLLGTLLKGSRYEKRIKETNQKLFRVFTNKIRQQIQLTRALLDQSRFEPALRGIFPEKKYLKLLQILDTMLNLMLHMELALEKVDTQWRMEIINQSWIERKNMISSILTALQLASNALMNKTPLPPYILAPTKARRVLTDKVLGMESFDMKRLADPEYTYYSTYMMNSEQLAVEIEVLVSTIRDLVGSDSVSVMLDYIY
ncbi:uncharacterized protein BX664DRAFT_253876 [Halteromyces radiatus]|uniref:uncharacterized protein n=1 Tax=Halteromyces radiatus TaxID=101107 RepID=UPI0022206905|nr:uncharacterized protein BX664DRAFT_253876 [Halteromyces radiatus]KAI8100188.1 hypothetical protein BX664DRAFT_253876 [Halteromyces radiatus]